MTVRLMAAGLAVAAWTALGSSYVQAQTQPSTAQQFMARPGTAIVVPSVTPPAPVMRAEPLTSTPSTPGGGVVRLVNTKPAASDAGRPSGPIIPPGQVIPIDNTVQPLGPNFLGLTPMPTERAFQNPPGHSFAPRAIQRPRPDRERQGTGQ